MPDLNRRTVLSAGVAGASVAAGSVAAGAAKASDAAAISPLPKPSAPVPVAILLDESATMIDFAGPWEVFQDSGPGNADGFRLYTVAPERKSIFSSAGMEIVPKFSLDDAPQPKVVVIPAQASGRRDGSTRQTKVDWLKKVAADADIIMSVCTGAFLLGHTGLLDGLSATTHHDFFDDFQRDFPKVKLIRGRRFVDNGKFVTAGGLTSGIDASLHIVARYYGEGRARASADYMEHDSDGWVSGLQAL